MHWYTESEEDTMSLASTEHRSFGVRRGVEWWNSPLSFALL